jgi:hypothetical protein
MVFLGAISLIWLEREPKLLCQPIQLFTVEVLWSTVLCHYPIEVDQLL